MTKTKLLTIAVIVLGILNIAILAGFYIMRPGSRMNNISESEKLAQVTEHFGFNTSQMAEFEISKNNHRKRLDKLEQELRQLSLNFYLSSHTDAAERARLLNLIIDLDNSIYQSNIEHFDDIRKICGLGQTEKVDRFIKNLITQPRPGPNNPGPPPK